MNTSLSRRRFLQVGSTLVAAATLQSTSLLAQAPSPKRALKKGYMLNTFPGGRKALTVLDQFKMLKDAGFDGVEPSSELNPKDVLNARDATGLAIASVSCGTGTRSFASPKAAVREKAVRELIQDLKNAKEYGASSVLVVPGVVNEEVSYLENYKRSQECIRQVIPAAEKLGVKMAIENVWNNFLLSPLEAVRFVDEFNSPAVAWHFDVGNILYIGWPEHWIRALNKRIAKVHIKEFSRKKMTEQGLRSGFAVEYFGGDNNWPGILKAFDEIHYEGWFIVEPACGPCKQDGTPAEYLKRVAGQLDKIIAS